MFGCTDFVSLTHPSRGERQVIGYLGVCLGKRSGLDTQMQMLGALADLQKESTPCGDRRTQGPA